MCKSFSDVDNIDNQEMIKCSEVDGFPRLSYQYRNESARQVICYPNDLCHRFPQGRVFWPHILSTVGITYVVTSRLQQDPAVNVCRSCHFLFYEYPKEVFKGLKSFLYSIYRHKNNTHIRKLFF